MFPEKISKEEVNQLPLKAWEGKIVLAATADQHAQAIAEIREYTVTGFDTETRPSFRKGVSYPLGLLQIAVPGKVYLLRIHKTGLTPALAAFLSDPNILKVGIGLLDDLRALQELAPNLQLEGFFELDKVTKEELGIQQSGLRNLTSILLGFRVSKSQQTSNWNKDELSEGQKRYAATDAWACLALYERLEELGFID